nr:immunoglobulin heavy chain junction region [Mus musculus]
CARGGAQAFDYW